MTKNLVCIVCPKGCRMKVTFPDNNLQRDTISVEGNSCERGKDYAIQEIIQPQRVLTSTVKITGSRHSRLPVKTNRSIPKSMLLNVMRELDQIEVKAPVRTGDILIANIGDTGADIVATRDMGTVNRS